MKEIRPGWVALHGKEVLADEDLPSCCRREVYTAGEVVDCPGCGARWNQVVRADGPAGEAERLYPGRHEKPEEGGAQIAMWFLHLPEAHPAWQHYMLTLIHLRDLPGMPPATKEREDDTHEIVPMPLDSGNEPHVEDLDSMRALTPPNIAVQFRSGSDEEAMEVAEMVVWRLVRGTLPAEPVGIRGAEEGWRQMVRVYADGERALNEHDGKGV